MTYFCDIRRNSFNNIMEFNSRLFIEGQEYTPNNFAPVALSYAPSNFQIGTTFGPAIGQFSLGRTYVRGGMGIWPQSGAAGMFDSTRVSCGQDVSVGAVWSATQGRLYAAAMTNNFGLTGFDSNLRPITSLGGITLNSGVSTFNSCAPVHVFLPLSSGRWIVLTCVSGAANLNTSTASGISSLTETGTVGASFLYGFRTPAATLIGDNAVIVVSVQWSGNANTNSDVQITSVVRSSGVITAVNNAWMPYSVVGFASHGIWPSHTIMESASQGYFYYPLMTASALTVYAPTLTGLGSGGTPAITAYNAAGGTLTAVGGGPLDTSALAPYPGLYGTTNRHVRAFVTETAGTRYLHVYVFEPFSNSATVPLQHFNLYVWRLDSKTTATFVQKVDLTAGRLRAIIPTDSSQTRIVAVYDDRLVFYQWASVTETWVLQSTQPLQTRDVGVDTLGRVWATTSTGTYRSTGVDKQELHLFETAGALANIEVSFDAATYTFTGLIIDANLVLNAFDTTGNRVAISVRLDRVSTNFAFAGNNASVVVSTSLSADTLVPISIFGTGQVTCRAAPTT
jgi:hypothetical protein